MVELPNDRIATASRDETVRIWSLSHPEEAPIVLSGHTNWVSALCVLPDGSHIVHISGRLVSGGNDKLIYVWNLSTLQPEETLIGHEGAVCALASMNGQIVSASWDK